MGDLVGELVSGGLSVYALEWAGLRPAIKWMGAFLDTLLTEAGRYAVLGGLK